ncbi:MAG: type IV pilus twitching motility protein PilT [Tissierellia bacterium]|nr:type IV pilus twitching motility protein PilT [Tissierellia bacterium]
MELLDLIKYGIDNRASDIHITTGIPPAFRIDGVLRYLDERPLSSDSIEALIKQILTEEKARELEFTGEIDISYFIPSLGRFRMNIYKQRGCYAVAIRIIPSRIPTIEELGLPTIIKDLARLSRGLILVTGPTGSGKSTTLASIINQINQEKNCHIITLEDPIEYLHIHKKSIVNQREIKADTLSFSNGLRAALRQDPDVILVGEMRDLDTISTALTAAETGHLVLSTLHTSGAAKSIDRIIDVLPPHQQLQVRLQISSVIQAIISQQLLPKAIGKGRLLATEIMIATPAIRNLIREGKTYQIDNIIQTSKKEGMQTMDNSLLDLYKQGLITKETVLKQAADIEYVARYII